MDFLLGALAVNTVAMVAPYVVNSIGSVKRPKRVDIEKARREACEARPVIPYRAPKPYTGGRVRGLFIGINYTGTSSQLSGCVNDVRQMLSTFQRIGFPLSECCVLVDDRRFPNYTDQPTRKNIIKYLAWLVYDVRPGDVLFLHYSGHGTQTKSLQDSSERYDQCLVPLDYQSKGAIVDDDLFELIVKPLPAGVRMTVLFDCCHSGSLLDLPFSFVGSSGVSASSGARMGRIRDGNYSRGDVVMFSGCEDGKTSADVQSTASFGSGSQGAGGAATQALTWALLNTSGLSTLQILIKARDLLRSKGYKQVPQLSSSMPMDLSKPFSLFGPISVDHSMSQMVPQQYANQYSQQQQQQPPHANYYQPPQAPPGGYPQAYTAPNQTMPVQHGPPAQGIPVYNAQPPAAQYPPPQFPQTQYPHPGVGAQPGYPPSLYQGGAKPL